jgi:hypothetical protein
MPGGGAAAERGAGWIFFSSQEKFYCEGSLQVRRFYHFREYNPKHEQLQKNCHFADPSMF